MLPFRHHRRRRLRIALVAIAALLWSQFVLAGHSGCFPGKAPADHARIAAVGEDCGEHGPAPAAAHPVCAVHCSQGDASAESGRIPPVPPMLPAAGFAGIGLPGPGVPGTGAPPIEASPPASWHRPTPHPAALLLI